MLVGAILSLTLLELVSDIVLLMGMGAKTQTSDNLVFRVPGPLIQPIMEIDRLSSHHPLGIGRRYPRVTLLEAQVF